MLSSQSALKMVLENISDGDLILNIIKKNIEVSERLDRLVIDSKLNEGIRCYDLGDYEETMKYCDEALEINPSSIRALFLKRQAMVKIR
jgi:tetratricopeptide (TPR) repeat protein